MSADDTHPTPYPDVNAALRAVLSGAKTVLGDQFVGMIVHGSLASGDFDPQSSDIDFVVITADELPHEMFLALEAMHARITASGLAWATRAEVSYIPQAALRRHDPAHAQHPALRADGSFAVSPHGSDWIIQRHIIREQGIVLAGPDLRAWIDPVQPDDLRQAVTGVLREWWSSKLDDPTWVRSAEYQAFAVLTMCRALHTLQHGSVVSKPAAARWAQDALGDPWAALIERASAWQRDAPFDHLNDTLDLIRLTLARSQQYENPAEP
jgi:hypothetical protein